METIVVGVDGSPGADEAVRHAAREARLRGARLLLVTTWHVPAVAYGGVGASPLVGMNEEFQGNAEAIQEETLKRLGGDLEGLEVEHVVREGRAASVLLEEAARADLLVVGSRGHGGFVGLLLGSVSSECAQHAEVPVLIVHAAGVS